jgi:hypothetical protein
VLKKDLNYARTMLPLAQEFCKETELKDSVQVLDRILIGLGSEQEDEEWIREGTGVPTHIDVAEFQTEIRHARETIERELKEHGFVQIVPDRLAFFMKDALFGRSVRNAFPQARYDIQEVGNCLATEADTAFVFHLMRVAEFGMRALAFDRRIRVSKGPVDLATWEEIIRQLETAEQEIQTYPKTHAREAQFQFYHGAMMEFRGFKNVWRNCVMHTREKYDRNQAMSAMTHVGEFMKILASKIGEGKRTPKRWKRA